MKTIKASPFKLKVVILGHLIGGLQAPGPFFHLVLTESKWG